MYTPTIPITPNAENVLQQRYYKNQETSWEQVVARMCQHIGVHDPHTINMLLYRYMLPNTPTIVNSGRKDAGLSACFVLDIYDDIRDIYDTKYHVAEIARSGGGVGIGLSHLRPAGATVKDSSHQRAAGPVAFAHTISVDAMVLTQGGSLRPMALMFVLDVHHPDIRQFITAKSEEGVLSNANISVMVDDEFMQAVATDSTYDLHFQGKIYETINARDLFELLATHAHKNGEPGLLFRDKINRTSPYRYDGCTINATNPCGEIPAPDNAVCNLASLALPYFVQDGSLRYDLLADATSRAVIFLNQVIDSNFYPTADIRAFVERYRPIGLGIMGLADMLLALGVRYGSNEAAMLTDNVMKVISVVAHKTSAELGVLNGVPDGCIHLPEPRSNVVVLSVAPTGSISTIAGVSSGCEPVFSPVVQRQDGTGSYTLAHPLAEAPHFTSAINDDPAKVVTVAEHLRMLSVVQKYVDSGVSKTINLPHTASVVSVMDAIVSAWDDPYIKGVALYRDGSRSVQVLSSVDPCPECETPLQSDGGCQSCPVCGWGACAIS